MSPDEYGLTQPQAGRAALAIGLSSVFYGPDALVRIGLCRTPCPKFLEGDVFDRDPAWSGTVAELLAALKRLPIDMTPDP